MNSFAINLEPETNNFIVSSNLNEAKMSFFDTIDSSQIQLAKRVQIIAEAVALFVTVIGIYANRMIGLKLIAVLQTAFFMQSTTDYAPEILNTLNQYCIAINGYNSLYQKFPNIVPLQYKYSNIPQRLKDLGYQAEFYLILTILVLNLVLFVLRLLLKILRFPKKLSEFMFKDLFFGMNIFNTINIGFNIGAYFTYFTFDSNITYGNNACILVAFALTIISGFIYALKQTDEFQGYTMHLKQERHLHPLFHFGHKFLMALIMGFFTFYPKLTYILVVVSGIYLLYIVIMKPYKNSLLQFRAFLNEAVICLIAVVALYYQNYANNDIIQSTQYLAWSQNAMVLIITIMSALIMLREVYNRCTGNRQYKIMEESKMNNLNDNKGKLEIVEAPGSSQHNIEVIRFNEAEESPKNNTKRKFIRKNVRQ